MNNQEWENSFLQYYSKSRTFSKDAIEAAISKLTSDNQERDKLLEISANKVEGNRIANQTIDHYSTGIGLAGLFVMHDIPTLVIV